MIVSVLGLVISLFAYLIAFPDPRNRRLEIYGLLLIYHLIACIAYWLMSFEEGVDAYTYWRDPYNFVQKSIFESGTFFIVHVVQTMRTTLGGSFLDHFIFFQCFGMIGIALMIRMFNEIAESLNIEVPWQVYLVLLLPGLNFWTAMIGKDGPMLLAVALAMWASLRIHKRLFWMVPAIILMVLIRPHVAAVAVTATVGALLLSRQLSSSARLLIAPVAFLGLVLVVWKASDRFGVTLDPTSLSDFVEGQQSLGEEHSRHDLQSLPYPLKVLSLLFRPFFFDERGVMALVASVENTILLYIFGYIAYHWRLVRRLAREVYYIVYCLIYSSVLIALLSLVNYNVGLGLRQKMMAIPAVLLIYVTIYMYKRHLAAAQVLAYAQEDQHAGPSANTATAIS